MLLPYVVKLIKRCKILMNNQLIFSQTSSTNAKMYANLIKIKKKYFITQSIDVKPIVAIYMFEFMIKLIYIYLNTILKDFIY